MKTIKKYRLRRNGKRGLVLTMPKDWVVRNGLEAGDVVVLTWKGGESALTVRKES